MNSDKFRCECKQSIDKGRCDEEYIWNPSTFACECDKSCDVAEYLDYMNCMLYVILLFVAWILAISVTYIHLYGYMKINYINARSH